MTKSVYKYKELKFDKNGSIESSSLDYVIKPIQTSHFYLPTRNALNDPTEGVFRNTLNSEIQSYLQGVYGIGERHDLIDNIFNSAKGITQGLDTSGIFSLTGNHTDELMWAHYADSHKGIVIEYDLDLLTRFVPKNHLHIFDVTYDKKPPHLGMRNISSRDAMQVMFGYKSPRWYYEDECRIVIDNIHGQIPHDYRAVKSITFGYRFPKDKRDGVIELVKDRVKQFYEVILDENSYDFRRVLYKHFDSEATESKVDVDWTCHLSGFSQDARLALIDNIEDILKLDPHYSELTLAEKSTAVSGKVTVQYEVSHKFMDLQISNKFHKVMVDIAI
ncbi:TPA: DUF2971 domain-containing protein [Vibrio parahaemolyticus]